MSKKRFKDYSDNNIDNLEKGNLEETEIMNEKQIEDEKQPETWNDLTEKIEDEKEIKIEVIQDLKKKFDLNKISQMVVNQSDLAKYLKSIGAKPSGGNINGKRVITGFHFEGKLINIRSFYK